MLIKMLFVAAALALATTAAVATESTGRFQFLSPQVKDGSVFLMFDRQTGRTWFLSGPASAAHAWVPIPYTRAPKDQHGKEKALTPDQ